MKSLLNWSPRLLSWLSVKLVCGAAMLPLNSLQLVLAVIVCPSGGMSPSVWRSACVLMFRASRGPAVAPSTQPKTSTASASVATAPMPVRRLVCISAVRAVHVHAASAARSPAAGSGRLIMMSAAASAGRMAMAAASDSVWGRSKSVTAGRRRQCRRGAQRNGGNEQPGDHGAEDDAEHG